MRSTEPTNISIHRSGSLFAFATVAESASYARDTVNWLLVEVSIRESIWRTWIRNGMLFISGIGRRAQQSMEPR